MKVALVLAVVVAAAVVDAGGDASTTSTSQKVDNIMSAVEDHCSARRKRQVGPSSEDKVRRLILNVVKDCLEGDKPETTQRPPSSTVWRSSTVRYPSSSTTTQPPNLNDPCHSPATVNLTEDWRLDNKGSDIQPINGSYNCDAPLFNNITWFRITGAAGNRIRDSCSPPYSCGSHGGIWTNASMPSVVGQELLLPLYGSWAGNCDWYPWQVSYPLTAKRCSAGNNFVYKVNGLSGCYHSVCGMWAS